MADALTLLVEQVSWSLIWKTIQESMKVKSHKMLSPERRPVSGEISQRPLASLPSPSALPNSCHDPVWRDCHWSPRSHSPWSCYATWLKVCLASWWDARVGRHRDVLPLYSAGWKGWPSAVDYTIRVMYYLLHRFAKQVGDRLTRLPL